MSEQPVQPEPAEQPEKRPSMMRFKPNRKLRKFPEEVARRQSGVTELAFLLLGRDKALTFLNDEHAALGGKPIDLAGSEQGCAEVEIELRQMTCREVASRGG